MKLLFVVLMTIQIASAQANCTAICTYKVCDNSSGKPVCEEFGNVSSNYTDLSIIQADTFAELTTICEDSAPHGAELTLYSTIRPRVIARYLQRVWLAYDTEATEANSCFP